MVANGTQPLRYQLRLNNVDVLKMDGLDGKNFTFVLTNAQISQQGIYSVAASNDFGSVVNCNALRTTLLPP